MSGGIGTPPIWEYTPFRQVIGINPDLPSASWVLQPSFVHTTRHEAIVTSTQGVGELRIRDSQGGLLYSTHFELSTPSYPDLEGAYFSVRTPTLTDEHTIEVYNSGVLQDSIVRSTSAPTVTILSPLSGTTIDENTDISWQAGDADSDPLLANVAYSADAGETWHVLAVKTADTLLPLTPADLPSASDAIIKVSVSDGFHNQDGWLGSGPALNVASLSLGTHVITFEATDSGGATGSHTVSISVQ
jgi:hypothetical protein